MFALTSVLGGGGRGICIARVGLCVPTFNQTLPDKPIATDTHGACTAESMMMCSCARQHSHSKAGISLRIVEGKHMYIGSVNGWGARTWLPFGKIIIFVIAMQTEDGDAPDGHCLKDWH